MKYDLVVVGTGFASTFFLKSYLEKASPNSKVLVLERGQMHPLDHRLKLVRDPSLVNDIVGPNQAYKSSSDKPWVFDPNFGGSSNCWTGCTPRFMPSDFEIQRKYGVGQDWPISYDDIEEYYCQAEDIMAIAGPQETPYPKSREYPLPPHALSSVDLKLKERYGDLYISQPTARASKPTKGRGVCCSTGVCRLCPVNAKFTIENSLEYLYKDPRVTLQYNSQAHSLELRDDHAVSIEYRSGQEDVKVQAETFVLGANAIFNAHILLNSGDKNPFTGAGISEQVGTYARLYYDGLENLGGGSVITANGFMMYDGESRKDYAGCLIESFNTPFIRNEKGRWREMSIFKFIFEDIPDDANRVITTGDPLVPEVVYNGHSAYLQRGIDLLEENIHKVFGFLPIESIEMDGYVQKTEAHICSTTRMSDSADSGVIDKNLVHHKYRNVLVLGSGAYPVTSPANPTLTLSALSLYAADKYLD